MLEPTEPSFDRREDGSATNGRLVAIWEGSSGKFNCDKLPHAAPRSMTAQHPIHRTSSLERWLQA